jgi:uncharacterized membrane protein YeaQ/YmgE (transglycosylase-associated protein family)
MDYIIFALVGLVVGAIAKLIIPGKQGGGIIVTAILGCLGSLLGSYGANALGFASANGGLMKWVVSIAGAIVVVFIYSLLTKKSDAS